MRKEQAQQIYAVSNAKKKIKLHHRNSDLMDIFKGYSKKENQNDASKPTKLKPICHQNTMGRSPKAAQGAVSALSPLNKIASNGSQMKTTRIPYANA